MEGPRGTTSADVVDGGYAPGGDRPLRGYVALTGLYNAAVAGFVVAYRRRGRSLPERIAVGDVVLVGVATHKLSRLVTKDFVTSFLRAPFTRYAGEATTHGEVQEEPRGRGTRRAVGELLTCPFCMDQWIAATFLGGLLVRPRATRAVAAGFASVTIADLLHLLYVRLTKAASGG